MSGPREVEVKLPVAGAAEGRALLRESSFRISRRRVFEANTLFDAPRRSLSRSGSVLRVRQAGRRAVLTYKGPAVPGKHKDREELEVEVADSATFADIFARIGFARAFRYEKYRTEYQRKGESGVATLDETPIGVYLELEGKPAWIDRQARRLGFHERDFITASYYALYMDYCRARGIRPRNMTFRPALKPSGSARGPASPSR
jgi:adenylate cyclase, class 2